MDTLSLPRHSQERIFLRSLLWKSDSVPGGKCPTCMGIPLRLWVPGVSLITSFSHHQCPGIYQSVWAYGSSISSWKANGSRAPPLALTSAVWGEALCSVTSVLSRPKKSHWFSTFLALSYCKDGSDWTSVLFLYIKHIPPWFCLWSA